MADISINRVLRGHYAYFGVAGNIWSLKQVYRRTERYWYKMLSSRIWHGRFTWEARLLYSEEGRPGMADYLPDPHGQSAIAMALSSIDRTDQRPERRR